MPVDWSPGVPTERDQQVLDVLRARDGVLTVVRLVNGDVLEVWDVAWGYDAGNRWAHVSTNTSPGPSGSTFDHFHTYEVAELLDPDSLAPLVPRPSGPPPGSPAG